MPADDSIDNGQVTRLIARTAAETDAPYDYSPLPTSTYLSGDGETTLADASADTRFEYDQYLAALRDWIALAQSVMTARAAGKTPPQPIHAKDAKEWDDVLRNFIADRHGLANYMKQHYRGRVTDGQQRIRDL